jgi:DNA-binding FadR family transcriptional regulator
VRGAVKVLKDGGWVTVMHGLGTYVLPPEAEHDRVVDRSTWSARSTT